MHWFWMVLICALILFAWWKLRRFCSCPGPSKEDRKNKCQARWNQRQLDEIEEKINKYEKKLEDIRSLRNSLGLGPGANSSALKFSSVADQSSDAWRSSWMASEHISLPGSSNVVAVSYKGTDPDLRRA